MTTIALSLETQPARIRRAGLWLFLFTLALGLLLVNGRLPAATNTATDGDTSLSFTSEGQALLFQPEGFTMSNGRYALQVHFMAANPVTPQNTQNIAAEEQNAPLLNSITYPNLWDGITLTYDRDSGVLRSTYTIAPDANPAAIHLAYNRPVTIQADGTLAIAFEDVTIYESAPVAWQDLPEGQMMVDVRFEQVDAQTVTFALGSYDPAYPLTIDPTLTLVWHTFLGGSSDDLRAIAMDGSGNIVVAGSSSATWGSPVRAYTASSDAFAAKLNSSGSLLWHTFLGGTGWDDGNGITVDDAGNVYVSGISSTSWGSSPTRAYSGGYDAFVTKLDSSGNLLWHTFLGSSNNDYSYSVAVDGSGNVVMTGDSSATWGSPVRAYTASSDAFAAKLNNSGSLLWHTFLGGSGPDFGLSVIVDNNGDVVVGGRSEATWGSPIRAYTAGSDAFAAKLNGNSGSLLWQTFLGGTGWDFGQSISVDSSGNVVMGGFSSATWGSPVRAYTALDDAFAAKVNGSSGTLLWHTFLGGSGLDHGFGTAVDSSGNIYVTGDSNATWGSPLRAYTASRDTFAAKLDSSGNLLENTFLGGANTDDSSSIAVDGSGNVIVGGYSDTTWGSPVQSFGGGSSDGFVALLAPFIWDGDGVDNNWSTAANWNHNTAPGAGDDVYFNGTSTKDSVIDIGFGGVVANVNISSAYTGTIAFGRSLAVSNSFTQDGGTVVVNPAHPFTVDGSFTHTGGTLQETNTVGSSSTVNFLQIQDSGSTIDKYRGVDLDTTGSGSDLGSVTVSVRGVDTAAGEYCTSTGITSPPYANRCFAIIPSNNLPARITLWALTSEVPGTVTSPSIYRYSAGSWQEVSNIATGASGGYTWVAGDTPGFSSFLVAQASSGIPTAVSLQSLSTSTNNAPLILLAVILVSMGTALFLIRHRPQ